MLIRINGNAPASVSSVSSANARRPARSACCVKMLSRHSCEARCPSGIDRERNLAYFIGITPLKQDADRTPDPGGKHDLRFVVWARNAVSHVEELSVAVL